jgi:hypothetical protein
LGTPNPYFLWKVRVFVFFREPAGLIRHSPRCKDGVNKKSKQGKDWIIFEVDFLEFISVIPVSNWYFLFLHKNSEIEK